MKIDHLVKNVKRSQFKWRYIDNLRPVLSYRLKRQPQLAAESKRALSALNENGIAITSVEKFLGTNSSFHELRATIESYERELATEIAARRAASSNVDVQKSFNFSHIIGRRKLQPDDIFLRFALQPAIMELANAYFGMYTLLRYCNVWHTFATKAGARDSQLWHHDRDDRYILKMFVYLSDVDEGSGPFTYAPGTHLKGKVQCRPKSVVERDGGPERATHDEMAKVFPSERWVKATGPIGSIVFADTRGYHCGGLARDHDRLMFIVMFSSLATAPRNDSIRPTSSTTYPLSEEQAFALTYWDEWQGVPVLQASPSTVSFPQQQTI
jgi:hypothetical protein